MDASLFIAQRLIEKSSKRFTRVIITIATITIALSIVVMVCSNSVINGFQKEISNKIFGFWGNIHINDAKISRSFETIPINKSAEIVNSISGIERAEVVDEETGTVLRSKGGVNFVQSYSFCPGVLNRKKTFEGIILKGISDDYKSEVIEEFLQDGETIKFSPEEESRDLIISEMTANRLEVKLGDNVIINFAKDRKVLKKRFELKGIYKTGLEEYDKKFAYCDLRVVQEVLGWTEQQITGYEVFLDHVEDANIIADEIYENHLPLGLYAETIQEKRPNIFEWLGLLNINVRIIIILMIIVSIINMATVILIFILDRSHMIGVLKSVGFKDWTVRKIFLLQSIWLLLKGILIGNIIALAILFIQHYGKIIKLDEASYYLSYAPVDFSLSQILMINLIVIVVTSLTMILPTYIISRIRPIKVLEFA